MNSREIAEAISAGLNSLASIVQYGPAPEAEETALSISALRRMEDALDALDLGLRDGTFYGPVRAALPGEASSVRAVRQALEATGLEGERGSVAPLAEQCLLHFMELFDQKPRT